MKPLLTAITFDFRQDGIPAQRKHFLFEPSENAGSDWLNQPQQDFNIYLKSLVKATDLESGNITVVWEDGVRALLPLPIRGIEPNLTSIGDLVERIVQMMLVAEGFKGSDATNNVMMRIADRIGRLQKAQSNPRVI